MDESPHPQLLLMVWDVVIGRPWTLSILSFIQTFKKNLFLISVSPPNLSMSDHTKVAPSLLHILHFRHRRIVFVMQIMMCLCMSGYTYL